MIYVMIRTYYAITPDSKFAVNKLIDFLELDLKITSPDMLYMPSKNVIKLRIKDKDVKKIHKLERYVKTKYPYHLEWEVHEEEGDHYMVQFNYDTKDMMISYLLKLYPAKHIWEL